MRNGFNRREFLKISGGTAAVLVLSRCNNGGNVGEFAVGNASSFSLGSATLFNQGPFFVLRDEGGLYAMSALCTHDGCTVDAGADSLICPCHAATYDLDGNVTGGPAMDPLDHFKVTVDSNNDVTVNTGTVVASSDRVPVG